MKRMTITVSYEQEKLKALQFYAGKNGTSLESDLDAFMEKLYKKYVPSQTREYIESMAEPEEQPRPRSARSPRSASSYIMAQPYGHIQKFLAITR